MGRDIILVVTHFGDHLQNNGCNSKGVSLSIVARGGAMPSPASHTAHRCFISRLELYYTGTGLVAYSMSFLDVWRCFVYTARKLNAADCLLTPEPMAAFRASLTLQR